MDDLSGYLNDPQLLAAFRILDKLERGTPANPKRERAKAKADVRRPKRADRPRCGATCRDGHPCRAPAVWLPGEPAPRNGRCRLHGGLSTGPKTAEGKAAIAESNRRRAAIRQMEA